MRVVYLAMLMMWLANCDESQVSRVQKISYDAKNLVSSKREDLNLSLEIIVEDGHDKGYSELKLPIFDKAYSIEMEGQKDSCVLVNNSIQFIQQHSPQIINKKILDVIQIQRSSLLVLTQSDSSHQQIQKIDISLEKESFFIRLDAGYQVKIDLSKLKVGESSKLSNYKLLHEGKSDYYWLVSQNRLFRFNTKNPRYLEDLSTQLQDRTSFVSASLSNDNLVVYTGEENGIDWYKIENGSKVTYMRSVQDIEGAVIKDYKLVQNELIVLTQNGIYFLDLKETTLEIQQGYIPVQNGYMFSEKDLSIFLVAVGTSKTKNPSIPGINQGMDGSQTFLLEIFYDRSNSSYLQNRNISMVNKLDQIVMTNRYLVLMNSLFDQIGLYGESSLITPQNLIRQLYITNQNVQNLQNLLIIEQPFEDQHFDLWISYVSNNLQIQPSNYKNPILVCKAPLILDQNQTKIDPNIQQQVNLKIKSTSCNQSKPILTYYQTTCNQKINLNVSFKFASEIAKAEANQNHNTLDPDSQSKKQLMYFAYLVVAALIIVILILLIICQKMRKKMELKKKEQELTKFKYKNFQSQE